MTSRYSNLHDLEGYEPVASREVSGMRFAVWSKIGDSADRVAIAFWPDQREPTAIQLPLGETDVWRVLERWAKAHLEIRCLQEPNSDI
jgi:hypothetical protein